MGEEKALAMEYLSPELEDELNKQHNGIFVKRASWGLMKYTLPENYRTLAEDIYRMPLRPDDIFVASYPRSGTTWMQQLVWLVANDLDVEKANSDPIVNRYAFLEESMFINKALAEKVKQNLINNPNTNTSFEMFTKSGLEILTKTKSRRFIKTHLPLSLLPPNLLQEAKVVYVARDPRDVVVSSYHFCKSIIAMGYNGDLKQYVDLFIKGLVDWAPCLEHIKEAWRQRHNPNLLFLFYEDLQKDLHGCIKKVTEFLGKKYTEEQIALIAEHLSFDNFKKNQFVDGVSHLREIGVFKKDTEFVRKGKSGGWREVFDEEMTEKINRWMSEGLKDTDLRFPRNSVSVSPIGKMQGS